MGEKSNGGGGPYRTPGEIKPYRNVSEPFDPEVHAAVERNAWVRKTAIVNDSNASAEAFLRASEETTAQKLKRLTKAGVGKVRGLIARTNAPLDRRSAPVSDQDVLQEQALDEYLPSAYGEFSVKLDDKGKPVELEGQSREELKRSTKKPRHGVYNDIRLTRKGGSIGGGDILPHDAARAIDKLAPMILDRERFALENKIRANNRAEKNTEGEHEALSQFLRDFNDLYDSANDARVTDEVIWEAENRDAEFKNGNDQARDRKVLPSNPPEQIAREWRLRELFSSFKINENIGSQDICTVSGNLKGMPFNLIGWGSSFVEKTSQTPQIKGEKHLGSFFGETAISNKVTHKFLADKALANRLWEIAESLRGERIIKRTTPPADHASARLREGRNNLRQLLGIEPETSLPEHKGPPALPGHLDDDE